MANLKRIYPDLEREIKEISYKEEKLTKILENINRDLARKAKVIEKLEKLRDELIEKYEKKANKGADFNELHGISEHIASINQKMRNIFIELERYIQQEIRLLRRIESGEKIDEEIIQKMEEKIRELSRRAEEYEKQMRKETSWIK